MIENIDINKIVVSNEVSFYKEYNKTRTLYIYLPKMMTYRRDFGKTKCMSFFRKDEKMLEKYNEIWKKVSNIIKKEFDSKPVYNKKYLKSKIKSYKGKINTKEGSHCIYTSVILIDSAYRKNKNYYSKMFIEKYKYVAREISSDEETSDDSD